MAWEPFAREVTAPDGTDWHVSIRWTPRRKPRMPPFGRWTSQDTKDSLRYSPELADGCIQTGGLAIVVLIVLVLATIFVLPVVALLLDIVVLFALAVGALAGRALFGRPWLVDAEGLWGAGAPEREWLVRCWRASRRCIDHVARELERGMPIDSIDPPRDKSVNSPD